MTMKNTNTTGQEIALDARWKDMYWIGGAASVTALLMIVVSVAAYVIWPYTPGAIGTAEIFAQLQKDAVGGVVALDLLYLMANAVGLLTFLALYAALKRVNESFALMALVFGVMAIVLIVVARPIAEVYTLSGLHAAAQTDTERFRHLAAGDALLAMFHGTGYTVSMLFGGLSLLISSLLMLKGGGFGKAAGYVGAVTNAAALCFFLPAGVGIVILFLSMIGYVVWNIQLAAAFFHLHRVAERL